MKAQLSFDPQERELAQYFKAMPKHVDFPGSVVLVQCVADPFYFGLFGQIASSLRKQKPIRVEQFVLRSVVVGESKSFWSFIKYRLIINLLQGHKWVRLYNLFCNGIAYRSTSFRPIADVIDLCRAWVCWRNLNDRKALMDLVIEDVSVGDLVNDTFLRYKPSPTVDLGDVYLWILLWQTHRDVRRAKSYFERVRPRLFLTSYSTYITHGIAVRVALRYGTRVFSFAMSQEFTKELSVGDWSHTKNSDTYADDFLKLDNPEEKLALAEAPLSTRMAGGIDRATAYMKKSAYIESVDSVPDVSGALVIFLHDFYDSPHAYLEMVFSDFWEWVCFTIETLNSANIPFFVKPHLNQISLSDVVLSELKELYPDISIISSGVTNKQLAKAKMACAVTVCGTVAHEMAYLGLPTIACARHPHISFDFCRTAKSREEYAEILRRYAEIGITKSKMHQQSLIFYYMHNLNIGEEEKSLRDATCDFQMAYAKSDVSNQNLIDDLKQISLLPGYKSYISMWLGTLNGTDIGEKEIGNEGHF
ncbi:hypothetical protein OAH16_00365 [bacterium]|nr:hypothetical protein [bacterium]